MKKIFFRIIPLIIFVICFSAISCNTSKASLEDSSSDSSISWLSVLGKDIVDDNGEAILLHGIQIDFGSMRGDVELAYKNNNRTENFLDRMLDHVITEEDFADIQSMNANMVRLSLNTYKDYESDDNPYHYNESNFQRLDRLIDWAEKYHIYVIISMRQSPGGHNTSAHSGNNGANQLWFQNESQQRIALLWKEIARRYKNRPIVAGYDLLNEPFAPDKKSLNNVYRQIIRAIREVDSKHILFLEGNQWGKDLDWIDDPADQNVVLSMHFYEPGAYAVKGREGLTYPSVVQGKEFNKKMLRQAFQKRLKQVRHVNRPIWVGEFGAQTKAGNYLKYDEDLLKLFNEFDVHVTYYHYKNLKGWSHTQAIYYADEDYLFKKMITAVKKGKSFGSFSDDQLNRVLRSLETSYFKEKGALKALLMKYF